jgi:hypothetical protein
MQLRFIVIWLVALFILASCPNVPVTEGEERLPPRESPKAKCAKITPECQRSIDRGMVFLLLAMRVDGSVGTDLGRPPDLGCTAMLGLALLAQGNTSAAGAHRDELRRVINAVLDMVDRLPHDDFEGRTPTLVQRKIGRNANLFLSTLFLSQLLGEASYAEKDVRNALDGLVVAICRAQRRDGTWGNESWAPVLGTVLGWECLRASASAGVKVEASAQIAGEALLRGLKTQNEAEQGWMHDFYKNTSSIRVLYSLNYRHDPTFKLCVQRILQMAREDDRPFVQAGGEEYLAFFLVTECLLQQPDTDWQDWYPTVRDKLVRHQNGDGSWSGHHCITARTFCTAAALLTLEAANLYLPLSNL